MNKKCLVILVMVCLMAALYFIELSKVELWGNSSMPTLDHLVTNEISKNWEHFYKVRANIIDGQSAKFSIPKEIRNFDGKEIELSGAAVFRGNGCVLINEQQTKIDYFFLLQTLEHPVYHRKYLLGTGPLPLYFSGLSFMAYSLRPNTL